MNVVVVLIVMCLLRIIPKGLERGLEDSEIRMLYNI